MTAGTQHAHQPASELPELLRDYLKRNVPPRDPLPGRVRLTQVGEMWMKRGGRAMPFRATQEYDVAEVAFSWRARFPLAPLVWLEVVDSFEAGEGALAARLWGRLRVMHSEGPMTNAGEAMRYLAELAWVPYAMVGNASLEIRLAGQDAVDVTTRVGDGAISVQLRFDASGDIAGVSAPARPRLVGKEPVETPWGGSFSDYRVVGGVRIPTRAEVYWDLPNGRFTYFRGTVTGLELG